jgi:hypothetical protein
LLATLVERFLVVFLPIALLVYPVFKFLPQIYNWFMQSKIMRLYDEMRSIESELDAEGSGGNTTALSTRLDQLDQRANSLQMPTTYASMLYTLRSHLDLVRARLTSRLNQESPGR